MTGSTRPILKVLYVGMLRPAETSLDRFSAIGRLGHKAIPFDVAPYAQAGGALASRIRVRLLVGPTVSGLNRDLLSVAARTTPNVVWFDKPTYVRPSTVRRLRAMGAYTVEFNIDNPFGPRNDPGGRLVRKSVGAYDLHLVQRDINLDDYRRAGARDVALMRTAYEPTRHFPPPESRSDADRTNDVVFIGAPYDDRPLFLVELWRRHGVPLKIWGSPEWPDLLPADARAALWQGGGLYGDAYREGIWRSRICLSFVTHSNCDDVAHKSFEIAACGGFLMAESTPGHRAAFVGGEEAVFFDSVDDCAAKIRRYLPDEAARARIAMAGRRRAVTSGYSNDARIGHALDYIVGKLPKRDEPAGPVT